MNSYESVCCLTSGHAGGRQAVSYRVYDAAVSDIRTGVPHDRRMPPSRRSPFMPCAQCPFSGCGMVVMNFSTGLYADSVFQEGLFLRFIGVSSVPCAVLSGLGYSDSHASAVRRALHRQSHLVLSLLLWVLLCCGRRLLCGCRSLCGWLHVQAGAAYTLRQAPGLTLASFMRLLVRGKCAVNWGTINETILFAATIL